MQRTIIVLADATRCRLFTFDRSDEVGGLHESLSERADLVNPARRQMGTDLDDHRDARIHEMNAEFARSIAAAVEKAIQESSARRLIVCASPKLLGALRAIDLRREGIVIDELPRDYVKMTPTQIREALVENGLLPAPPPRQMARTRAL